MGMGVATATGNSVNLETPDTQSITLQDIGYALSNIARFNGHLTKRITVAQHSVAVMLLVERACQRCDYLPDMTRLLCRQALLHDAHEAYIGDISTPVKAQLGLSYRWLEARVQSAIWRAIGMPDIGIDLPVCVKVADNDALHYEASRFLVGATWAHVTLSVDQQQALNYVYHPPYPQAALSLFMAASDRLGLR